MIPGFVDDRKFTDIVLKYYKYMIIIERSWREPDPRGGDRLHKTARKCFSDDDIVGVEKFINEKTKVSGYEWTNVEYKYIKL